MSTHPPCKHPGCDRLRYAKGLCSAHLSRQRDGRPMDAPIRRSRPPRPCYLHGCSRPARALGLCVTHYDRKRVGHPTWDMPIVRRQGLTPTRASLGKADAKYVARLDAIAKSRGLTRAILLDAMCKRYLEEGAPA